MKKLCTRLFIFTIILLGYANSAVTASILNDTLSITKNVDIDPRLASTALESVPKDLPLTLGYLALCEGTSSESDIIELGTVSKWSHIAMVLCKPDDVKLTFKDLSATNKASWFCLEATIDNAGKEVRLVPWSTFEETQKSAASIVLRPFTYPLNSAPNTEELKFINTYLGLPYEKFITELIAAAFRTNEAEHRKSLFCSELVAMALQHLNMLTTEKTSPDFMHTNNFVPADFSLERPHSLHLIGAQLGDELQAKPEAKSEPRKAFECFTDSLRCITQKLCCCSCVQ